MAAAAIPPPSSPTTSPHILLPGTLDSFKAPLNFCSLNEFHSGDNLKPLIVLIQDPHSNFSGQENLAGTLDELMKEYKIHTVFVEGASKEATLDPIKAVVLDKKLLKRVARAFLVQGELAGEEYLNLTSDHPMKIYGVEDKKLYLKSVDRYALLAAQREEALAYLAQIRAALNKIKAKGYPKVLLKYESAMKASDADSLTLLLSLADTAKQDLSSYPNMKKIVTLKAEEGRMDFNLANLEQSQLLELLGREDLEASLKIYNQSKNSKASLLSYFQSLLNKAKEKSIDLGSFSSLAAYIDYLKHFEQIDLSTLLQEQQTLEDEVCVRVIQSGPE